MYIYIYIYIYKISWDDSAKLSPQVGDIIQKKKQKIKINFLQFI